MIPEALHGLQDEDLLREALSKHGVPPWETLWYLHERGFLRGVMLEEHLLIREGEYLLVVREGAVLSLHYNTLVTLLEALAPEYLEQLGGLGLPPNGLS